MTRSIVSRLTFLLGLGWSWESSLAKVAHPSSCLGSPQAEKGVIYLHGLMDETSKTSPQEKINRDILENLATTQEVRIALPLSSWTFNSGPHQGKLYWPRHPEKSLQTTFNYIIEQSKACLKGAKEKALLGFSNGAYFALKVYLDIATTGFAWVGTVGIGNTSIGKRRLANKPPLLVAMGKQDISRTKAKTLYHKLKKTGSQASYFEFTGGHNLPANIMDWLQAAGINWGSQASFQGKNP